MKIRIAIMLAVVFFCNTAFVQAGVWANFWNAMGTTVEGYNADMLATGNAVNASLKEGKILAAFAAYDSNIQVVGNNALANSKAVYKALKEIVMWIPNQIKKIWDKFVAILQKIRDQLAAMNQPGGLGGTPAAPPASKASALYTANASSKGWMDNFDISPISSDEDSTDNSQAVGTNVQASVNDLGDGWVKVFENGADFDAKLNTFINYKGHTQTMALYMNGLKKEHFNALDPNYSKVVNECSHIEDLLLDELSQSLESDGQKMASFTSVLNSMDESEAKVVLGSLVKKVSKRATMLALNGDSSITETVSNFKKAVADKNM
jgi:hypothetical protein